MKVGRHEFVCAWWMDCPCDVVFVGATWRAVHSYKIPSVIVLFFLWGCSSSFNTRIGKGGNGGHGGYGGNGGNGATGAAGAALQNGQNGGKGSFAVVASLLIIGKAEQEEMAERVVMVGVEEKEDMVATGAMLRSDALTPLSLFLWRLM